MLLTSDARPPGLSVPPGHGVIVTDTPADRETDYGRVDDTRQRSARPATRAPPSIGFRTIRLPGAPLVQGPVVRRTDPAPPVRRTPHPAERLPGERAIRPRWTRTPPPRGCPARCSPRSASGCSRLRPADHQQNLADAQRHRRRRPGAPHPGEITSGGTPPSASTSPANRSPSRCPTADLVGAHHRGGHRRRLLGRAVRDHRPRRNPYTLRDSPAVELRPPSSCHRPHRRAGGRLGSGFRNCSAATAARTPGRCALRGLDVALAAEEPVPLSRTLNVPTAMDVTPTIWVRPAVRGWPTSSRSPSQGAGQRRSIDVGGSAHRRRPRTAWTAPQASRNVSGGADLNGATAPARGGGPRSVDAQRLAVCPPIRLWSPSTSGTGPRCAPSTRNGPQTVALHPGDRHHPDQPAGWKDVIDRTALGFDQLKPPGLAEVAALDSAGKPIAAADAAANRNRRVDLPCGQGPVIRIAGRFIQNLGVDDRRRSARRPPGDRTADLRPRPDHAARRTTGVDPGPARRSSPTAPNWRSAGRGASPAPTTARGRDHMEPRPSRDHGAPVRQ